MAAEINSRIDSESRSNPAFFIVGVPGSGTTSLQQLLDAQPGLAVAPDVHEVTRYYRTRAGLDREGLIAAPLIRKWIDQRKLTAFGIGREDIPRLISADELLPISEFVSRLLDLYGSASGKRLVGSRSLDFATLLPDVHALWPRAKVIHLIRDGRDVCLTLLNGKSANVRLRRCSTWASDPLVTIALWWAWNVRQARQAGRCLGPEHYLEVRHESIRDDPRGECARLGEFLGVSLDHTLFPREAEQAREEKDTEDPGSAHATDWRIQMSPGDSERFEAAAGDLLDELGYTRGPVARATQTFIQARALRDRFAQEMAQPTHSGELLADSRRTTGRTNPFVFIVGCPRSGTTLVQRILDAHPELAICPETFWVPYYYKRRIGLTSDGLVTADLVPKLFEYYKFYRMKAGREELKSLCTRERSMSYASFVSHIFDLFGETRGKPLVGDKTPDYVRNLETLNTLWPQAKFIHLVRDGREVALSAINWKRKVGKLANLFRTWSEDPVATAALWWEWHVRHGREAHKQLRPELYHELRYEELVSKPADECTRLCDFLGVPFHEQMLQFHEGRTRREAGLDAKNAWQPITAGLRDWRVQMSAPDLERFEHAVGDLLDELHYPRVCHPPGPDARRRVAAMRATFKEDAERLGDWLP